MTAYGGMDVLIHIFLTLVLVGGDWSASRPDRFTPGKSCRYPFDRKLGGPNAGLDDVEKRKFFILPGLELRPLSRPARSPSLYRLRYPSSWNKRIRFLVRNVSHPEAKILCEKEKYNFILFDDAVSTAGIIYCPMKYQADNTANLEGRQGKESVLHFKAVPWEGWEGAWRMQVRIAVPRPHSRSPPRCTRYPVVRKLSASYRLNLIMKKKILSLSGI
jgi:hypothetical protein